jgi:hypothetical protein
MMYAPGRVINASDRKYIVDIYGNWRVLEYKEEHWVWKKLQRIKNV